MNIICAYPINLDALHNVKGEELTRLGAKLKPELKKRISQPQDLISSLFSCMAKGSGDELLIDSKETASSIDSLFHWEYRLGGNAGIMANVLAAMGARPVLNPAALSPRLANMLHSGVSVPLSGRLVSPVDAAKNEEMIHFVFQFAKGDSVNTEMGKIVVPKDNRLIASYDPINSRLSSSHDFDSYCLRNIGNFCGALISGFHLVDSSDYRQIYDQKIEQIADWKAANSGLHIHLEMGSFQKPDMMKYLLENMTVDSVGLNEDELAMLTGFKRSNNWRQIIEALVEIRDRLALPRLAVHTGDFLISATRDFIPARDEIKALAKGAKVAASVAATGKIDEIDAYKINPAGQKAVEEFHLEGATIIDKGAFKLSDATQVCLVPSLLIERPKITVGLGDTVTAAIFFEEMKGLRKLSV